MPRRFKIPPPVDQAKLEAEIAKALIIRADLDVPKEGDIKGYVREVDVADMPKLQRKLAVRFSQIEEYSDWQTQVLIDVWSHLRQLDINAARDRIELAWAMEKRKRETVRKERIKWALMTLGAALIGALAKAGIDWLVK